MAMYRHPILATASVALVASVLLSTVVFLLRSMPSAATVTPYFDVVLPDGWEVRPLPPLPPDLEDENRVHYEVVDVEGSQAFVVTVAVDKPRFIMCFCRPWEEYEQYTKDEIQYADLRSQVAGSSVRTLKAVGKKYGTDVHLSYGSGDAAVLDRTIESIRPH